MNKGSRFSKRAIFPLPRSYRSRSQPVAVAPKLRSIYLSRPSWYVIWLPTRFAVRLPLGNAPQSQGLDEGPGSSEGAVLPFARINCSCAEPIAQVHEFTFVGSTRVCGDIRGLITGSGICLPFFGILQPECTNEGSRLRKGTPTMVPFSHRHLH